MGIMAKGTFELTIERELEIKINLKQQPTLFDLAFLSTDLLQIIFLSNFIDDENYDGFRRTFLKIDDRFIRLPNRRQLGEYLENYKENIKIKEIRTGSLILTLTGICAAASVIVPAFLFHLNKKILIKQHREIQRDKELIFNIKSNDPELIQFMEELVSGEFGDIEENFDFLQKILQLRGYNIEAIQQDVYDILTACASRSEESFNLIMKTKKYKDMA